MGFKDWKHATGKGGVLSKHDSSCAHRNSVISWKQYKVNSYRKTSISIGSEFLELNKLHKMGGIF